MILYLLILLFFVCNILYKIVQKKKKLFLVFIICAITIFLFMWMWELKNWWLLEQITLYLVCFYYFFLVISLFFKKNSIIKKKFLKLYLIYVEIVDKKKIVRFIVYFLFTFELVTSSACTAFYMFKKLNSIWFFPFFHIYLISNILLIIITVKVYLFVLALFKWENSNTLSFLVLKFGTFVDQNQYKMEGDSVWTSDISHNKDYWMPLARAKKPKAKLKIKYLFTFSLIIFKIHKWLIIDIIMGLFSKVYRMFGTYYLYCKGIEPTSKFNWPPQYTYRLRSLSKYKDNLDFFSVKTYLNEFKKSIKKKSIYFILLCFFSTVFGQASIIYILLILWVSVLLYIYITYWKKPAKTFSQMHFWLAQMTAAYLDEKRLWGKLASTSNFFYWYSELIDIKRLPPREYWRYLRAQKNYKKKYKNKIKKTPTYPIF